MSKKIVAVSGYFDPFHVGHLRYLKAASKLGRLVVIVNNNRQSKLKSGMPFMDAKKRAEIIGELRFVHRAFVSIDKDRTVRQSLKKLRPDIFAKGGDSNHANVPEQEVCDELGIKLVWNVGGRKVESSSRLLGEYVLHKKDLHR